MLLTVTFLNMYRADTYAKRADLYLKEIDLNKAQDLAIKAIKLNPNEPYYYRVLSKVYITKSINDKSYKEKVLKLLERSIELNVNNMATIRNNTPIYYYLALEDIPSHESKADEKYIDVTQKYIAKYKIEYPNDLGLLVLFAKYEKKLGLKYEYNESIKRIRKLRPDVLNWYPEL